ncbi:MAG: helix-turn-helix domain-containing protein [Bacteroidetes bacterium]|nr:helix-turn-helix domain-containing protein [Bacteroidota bacterium]
MKLENYRLIKDPDKSFILHHETHSFSKWHYHPEYELVLIKKGKGRRLVGDTIDRFRQNDLILVGSYLPHAWICDDKFNSLQKGFQGEAIVIQFIYDFLGPQFMEIPENRKLKKMLEESSRGIRFTGKTRDKIISLLNDSYKLEGSDQLHLMMTIFNLMSKTPEYTLLSSAGFMEPYHKQGNEPVQKAIDHILHNFQRKIRVNEMLGITNMSDTPFCSSFKRITRMTFKEYLLNARIGYACKLLSSSQLSIANIAYDCGFDNLSNFNQKFKRIKKETPSSFRKKAESLKIYPKEG